MWVGVHTRCKAAVWIDVPSSDTQRPSRFTYLGLPSRRNRPTFCCHRSPKRYGVAARGPPVEGALEGRSRRRKGTAMGQEPVERAEWQAGRRV